LGNGVLAKDLKDMYLDMMVGLRLFVFALAHDQE
jgi:hypothetical protein